MTLIFLLPTSSSHHSLFFEEKLLVEPRMLGWIWQHVDLLYQLIQGNGMKMWWGHGEKTLENISMDYNLSIIIINNMFVTKISAAKKV